MVLKCREEIQDKQDLNKNIFFENLFEKLFNWVCFFCLYKSTSMDFPDVFAYEPMQGTWVQSLVGKIHVGQYTMATEAHTH